MTMKAPTFDSILEEIEMLSLADQLTLFDIMQQRSRDHRRIEIAHHITQTKQDYQSGNIFRGSIDEAIAELNR